MPKTIKQVLQRTLLVTEDDDGGVTIRDTRSGVVVSIISGGRDDAPVIAVEPYAYETGKSIRLEMIQTGGRHPYYVMEAVPGV